MLDSLVIQPEKEKERIVSFIKKTFAKQGITNVIIGLSGGIDSATSFQLLCTSFAPEHIYVLHLYYEKQYSEQFSSMLKKANIPEKNIHIIAIKDAVDQIAQTLAVEEDTIKNIRIGNIAARVRMIMLYDYAKKYHALVCGTENKSENYLGYFTRFGDQASDIEPIEHLYKTQVYQLAHALNIPENIVKQKPSANLWQGQTDESEYGFTYEEADQVLSLAIDQQVSLAEIKNLGFTNAEKILAWRKKNLFKHETPYKL